MPPFNQGGKMPGQIVKHLTMKISNFYLTFGENLLYY